MTTEDIAEWVAERVQTDWDEALFQVAIQEAGGDVANAMTYFEAAKAKQPEPPTELREPTAEDFGGSEEDE